MARILPSDPCHAPALPPFTAVRCLHTLSSCPVRNIPAPEYASHSFCHPAPAEAHAFCAPAAAEQAAHLLRNRSRISRFAARILSSGTPARASSSYSRSVPGPCGTPTAPESEPDAIFAPIREARPTARSCSRMVRRTTVWSKPSLPVKASIAASVGTQIVSDPASSSSASSSQK